MKQFFEQYGAVALGVLALIVIIAMITPVGNIIKTSLQGTAETFSTQIGVQTDTALERAAYAQGVASDDIILVRNGSGSYSLSCEIDNANIERYVIRANDLDEGVPASDLYYDYMSKECSVSEMKGVIHYSTTKEGLEDLGMSIYHWEGGTWVLVSGDGSTKQSDRLPEVTGTVNYNGQTYELKYTLAFNSNGGTSVSSQKVSRIPENMYTPAKTGFTFSGWYTESSLTNRAVSGTKLTGDTTVYAGWNLQNYTIAYNLDGGTLSGQKTSYTINDSAYVLPTPTKEGFTFEGWYDNSSFTGTAVTSISAGSYGNKIYYAKWKTNSNASSTINIVDLIGEDEEPNLVIEGNNVTLLKDIVLQNEQLEINDVFLDLNGHDITGNAPLNINNVEITGTGSLKNFTFIDIKNTTFDSSVYLMTNGTTYIENTILRGSIDSNVMSIANTFVSSEANIVADKLSLSNTDWKGFAQTDLLNINSDIDFCTGIFVANTLKTNNRISIGGGTFEIKNIDLTTNGNLVLTGGFFSFEPFDYLENGYMAIPYDNMWEVILD